MLRPRHSTGPRNDNLSHDNLPRLLLGDAVDRTETIDERYALDCDDFAVGERSGDDTDSLPVVFVAVNRNEHDLVGDVKVGVARGEAAMARIRPCRTDFARHRKLNNFKLATLGICFTL